MATPNLVSESPSGEGTRNVPRKLCFLGLGLEVALGSMVEAAWRQEVERRSMACLDDSTR
ncbi:hypothetical protein E2C01_012696 [Portunus trituberculatus]|uniref:Uncharacterized protein n=1 Tax=Portunus trituberculatus TaxID=210409 RepID=A0A5B7DEP9_PORTR|nr:hypothetical protein [Portunus trituberculatus]